MRPTDNGAAIPTEAKWCEDAETMLRIVCRQQREDIQRLEREVRRLKRELREAKEALALAGTLPMRARKAVAGGV